MREENKIYRDKHKCFPSSTENIEDKIGLCTVRDAVQFMFEMKYETCEMFFCHAGKKWNIELRILGVNDVIYEENTDESDEFDLSIFHKIR